LPIWHIATPVTQAVCGAKSRYIDEQWFDLIIARRFSEPQVRRRATLHGSVARRNQRLSDGY
jgi:hypothetical protein